MFRTLKSFSALGRGMGALLVLVSAVVFVDTVFFTAVTPLLPHYVHTLRLSKSEAGVLVAAYPIGTLLGAMPGGLFASRIGVRPAVVAGLALMSAATLVFGFATSAVLLDLARFVQGVGGACTWAGGLAWLASAAPVDRRAAALGVAFGAAVGGALFGPVVGAIASRLGTGPTFAGATIAGTCLIVASLLVDVPSGDESQSLLSALLALRDPSLTGGMWLTFLAGLAFGVVDVLAPLRLAGLGASAIVIGAAFLLSLIHIFHATDHCGNRDHGNPECDWRPIGQSSHLRGGVFERDRGLRGVGNRRHDRELQCSGHLPNHCSPGR